MHLKFILHPEELLTFSSKVSRLFPIINLQLLKNTIFRFIISHYFTRSVFDFSLLSCRHQKYLISLAYIFLKKSMLRNYIIKHNGYNQSFLTF